MANKKKEFVLLCVPTWNPSDDNKAGEFYVIKGKSNVFNFLAMHFGDYNVIHSYVMSGNIHYGQLSLYSFMRRHIKELEDEGIDLCGLNTLANDYDLEYFDTSRLDNLYQKEINSLTKSK